MKRGRGVVAEAKLGFGAVGSSSRVVVTDGRGRVKMVPPSAVRQGVLLEQKKGIDADGARKLHLQTAALPAALSEDFALINGGKSYARGLKAFMREANAIINLAGFKGDEGNDQVAARSDPVGIIKTVNPFTLKATNIDFGKNPIGEHLILLGATLLRASGISAVVDGDQPDSIFSTACGLCKAHGLLIDVTALTNNGAAIARSDAAAVKGYAETAAGALAQLATNGSNRNAAAPSRAGTAFAQQFKNVVTAPSARSSASIGTAAAALSAALANAQAAAAAAAGTSVSVGPSAP